MLEDVPEQRRAVGILERLDEWVQPGAEEPRDEPLADPGGETFRRKPEQLLERPGEGVLAHPLTGDRLVEETDVRGVASSGLGQEVFGQGGVRGRAERGAADRAVRHGRPALLEGKLFRSRPRSCRNVGSPSKRSRIERRVALTASGVSPRFPATMPTVSSKSAWHAA